MATKIRGSNFSPSATTTITSIVTENSVDSALVTNLIDSAYIIARSSTYDSANFTGQLAAATTADLTEGSNLYYTTARFDSDFGDNTTSDLTEGSNLYYTTARADSDAKAAISVTDAGGDGSLSYSSGTITYTGPSASEVRAHFSAGTGVSISSGQVSIGQSVGTSDNVSFADVTLTGALNGPSTFYIDPAPVDSDAGLLVIRGDLQVDGTTTTVNSTTVSINDKNIVLADSAANASEADGAGITVNGASATIQYDAVADAWDFNKDVDVTGTVTADGLSIFSGDIKLDGDYPTGTFNVALGGYALDAGSLSGQRNTAIGNSALTDNTTGSYNTAVGHFALGDNTTGSYNTAVGSNALYRSSNAIYNTAVGYQALYLNTTGQFNAALGAYALRSNTTASNNTAMGYYTLFANTTGTGNTTVGYRSLRNNTTGYSNTAVGHEALNSNTTTYDNTAVGHSALYSNNAGIANAALGVDALRSNTSGSYNTGLGRNALYSSTTSSGNTAVGYNSLSLNTTGTYNVSIGYEALASNTTASSNTAIGYQALTANTTGTQNTVVGRNALDANTSGGSNVVVGYNALSANTTGISSVVIGTEAGQYGTAPSISTFVGYRAGRNTTGANNTFIGSNAGNAITSGAKNTIIGAYIGNQGGLDIRTSSNYIVLSDGDGNPRQVIDGSGNVGIGTSSPSSPLHIVSSTNPVIKVESDNVSTGATIQVDGGSSNDSLVSLLSSGTSTYALFRDGSQSNDLRLYSYTDTAGATDILRYGINGSLQFGTNGAERMRITSGGSVGIGTTSPSYKVDIAVTDGNGLRIVDDNGWANMVIDGGGGTSSTLLLQNYGNAGSGSIISSTGDGVLRLGAGGSEAIRILANGNVGIGDTAASEKLSLRGDTNTDTSILVRTYNSTPATYNAAKLQFELTSSSSATRDWDIVADDPSNNGGYLGVEYEGSEKFRIDASGNLLVGKTSSGFGTAGGEIKSSGQITGTASSAAAGQFNRLVSDGTILNFARSGSTVGSIGVASSELYFASGNTGLYFDDVNNLIRATNSSGALRDNITDLGKSDSRFKDLYLSGTVLTLNNGNNANGNIRLGSTANNSTKYMSIRGEQYASGTETEGYGIIGGVSTSSDNRIRIGGGLSEENAATQIEFITAGSTTTRGGTERMRINSSGHVLIGRTSTLGYKLDLLGDMRSERSGASGTHIVFTNSGGNKGTITTDASGTTYNTTSDIRLKTDIAPIADATEKLMSMNAVTHKWKADPDADAVHGFIAQEMAEIVPEAIAKGDGKDDMWSMDYGRITPVIVAALQDALKEIDMLKDRIAELEAK